jgi:putative transposase
MYRIAAQRSIHKNQFDAVANSFLQQPGLAFADILSAADIERSFQRRNALFAQAHVFSTQLVLWAYLAQSLRDGKGAACAAAVADIATYLHQTGQRPPSGDTGDYCRARAKLDLSVLQDLAAHVVDGLESQARPEWLWHGRHAKLVDGFTFTMPDTPANQRAFPQQRTQQPGVGLPIARACAVLSLATAAIAALAIGPYQGKQTGESALFRQIMDCLRSGDVAVFDRYLASYWILASLMQRGVAVCARMHQARHVDFRRGKRLGDHDHLVSWLRPPRPAWMPVQEYEQMPETLTLREVQFQVVIPGRRTETITIVTTLTDPIAYPKADLAELYGYRWNVELDIRAIKQTLGMDHLRCLSPAMIRREVWMKLLAYNLIRKVLAAAAAGHGHKPRQLGFTLACQTILSAWMLLATNRCTDAAALWDSMLARLAANQVANRPGRIEPRVLKRRRHRYPLMTRPRPQLRQELLMNSSNTT